MKNLIFAFLLFLTAIIAIAVTSSVFAQTNGGSGGARFEFHGIANNVGGAQGSTDRQGTVYMAVIDKETGTVNAWQAGQSAQVYTFQEQ